MNEAVGRGDTLRRTWLAECHTIGDVLQATAVRFPLKTLTFIEKDGREIFLTYSDLARYSRIAAAQLNGINSGDAVILQVQDIASYIVYFWAIVYRGGTPVPFSVPRRYHPDDRTAGRLISICSDLGNAKIVSDDLHIGKIYSLFSENGNEIPRIIRAKPLEDIANCRETELRPSVSRTAVMLQSSGSTGSPKIIPQSHQNILARCDAAIQMNSFSEGDRCLNCFPLDHVVGLVMCHIKDTILGCSQVIADPGLFFAQPLRFLDWCERFRISVTWAPHSALHLILTRLKERGDQHWDLSHLKFLENCAEPIVIEQCEEFLQILQPHGLQPGVIKPSWGMAETCSVTVVANGLQSKYQRDGIRFTSVGRPFPGVEIRIVDNELCSLGEGRVGRLQIRGPMVLHSYWQRDRTLDFHDGWFDTGDQAVIIDGELTIVGREKDTIIINGNNFAAYEFERAVAGFEGIDPSLIAAAPVRFDGDATDRVALFVCPTQDDIEPRSIVEQMVEATSVKLGIRPDFICFVPAANFPRTSVGKIQKSQLAQQLKRGTIVPVFGTMPREVGLEPEPFMVKREKIKSAFLRNAERYADELPAIILGPGRHSELGMMFLNRLRDNGAVVCEGASDIADKMDTFRGGPSGRVHCTIIDDLNGSGSSLEHSTLLELFRTLSVAKLQIERLNVVLVGAEQSSVVASDQVWSRMGLRAIVRSFAEEKAIGTVKLIRVARSACGAPGVNASLCEELVQGGDYSEIEYTAEGRATYSWREIGKGEEVCAKSLPPQRAMIVGGLGGVGRLIAAELLERNAAVLLIGRSSFQDLSDEKKALLQTLTHEHGDRVQYSAGNLESKAALQLAVDEYMHTFGLPDVVIHAASEPIQGNKIQNITESYQTKTAGSWTLIDCARDTGIPLVVMITSVLGLIGSASAPSYSLANAIQDDLVDVAAGDGKVDVRTIALSQVTGVGMSRSVSDELDRYLKARGLEPLTKDVVGSCFIKALLSGAKQSAVGLQLNAPEDNWRGQNGAEKRTKITQPQTREDIERQLSNIWAKLLKRDAIDPATSVFSYGADSIAVLAAYDQLVREVSSAVTIADVYEFPSIRALARRIMQSI